MRLSSRTYHGSVAEKGWTDFIEWARRALRKPSFDAEERAYRLAVAAAVRELITDARQARPLAGPAREVNERVLDSRYRLAPVVPARPLEQLTRLAEQDEQALAALLCAFAEAGEDPEARLERFLAEVKRGPGAERVPAGPLIGSLLNFGTSPERLPVVRAARYARLRELLGEESDPPAGELQDYRRDLTFAYAVETALRDAGVPVRDMIDVDSLMSICAVEEEFWAGPGDAADSRRSSAPEVYLAIGMIYRNEAPYLAEWLEFHRLVGVERFYLYDNESEDDHLEVLAPYIEEGIVEVHEWPGRA